MDLAELRAGVPTDPGGRGGATDVRDSFGVDSILKFLALDFFDYPIINGLTELHEP